MNTLEANIRNTKTKGDLNILRSQGNVPGVIYGGQDKNQNVYVSKKTLSNLLERDNFLSNIINLKIEGKDQNVLPREVKFDILSDEPTHVDILRIVKYPIFIFNFFIATIFPFLAIAVIILFYISKYYFWHRFDIHYPTFLVEND